MPVKSIGYRIYNVFRNAARRIARRPSHKFQGGTLPITSQMFRVDGVKAVPEELAEIYESPVYQHFLSQVKETLGDYYQAVEAVVNAEEGVHLFPSGAGAARSMGLDGVRNPIGYDRAFSYLLNIIPDTPGNISLIGKGFGLTRPKDRTYQHEVYRMARVKGNQNRHLVFDIHPSTSIFDHVVTGGNNFDDLVENFVGAFNLMKLIYKVEGKNAKLGGILFPLAIQLINEVPLKIERDGKVEWIKLKGWDYFTNPQIFNRAQLLQIAEVIKWSVATDALSASHLKDVARFEELIKEGRQFSDKFDVVRKKIGKAFMEAFAPAGYLSLGDEFRIGNIYRQLVSNKNNYFVNSLIEHGFLSKEMLGEAERRGIRPYALLRNKAIKKYMDQVLSDVFKLFGKKIKLPRGCKFDLRTAQGRKSYLTQFRAGNNAVAAGEIAKMMVKEIARQIGVVHGAGGYGGGHQAWHQFGQVEFILENKFDKTQKIRLVLKKDHAPKILDKERNKLDANLDLSGYEIKGMIAKKYGAQDGEPGGGVTRDDNVGVGLRDLHSVSVDASEIDNLIRDFPRAVNNLGIREQIFYLYSKMIQEADLQLLFGKKGYVGAFKQLNRIFGGNKEDFNNLVSIFWETYQTYYDLSREKNASAVYRMIDQDPPIVLIRNMFRERQAKKILNRYLKGDDRPRRASGPLRTKLEVA